MDLRLEVDVVPGAAALDERAASRRVDAHAAHIRQVDDQAAVDPGKARNRMAAAAHGDLEPLAAREAQRRDHVGCTRTPNDQVGMVIVRCVPERAGLVVAGVAAPDDCPAKLGGELGDGCIADHAAVRG